MTIIQQEIHLLIMKKTSKSVLKDRYPSVSFLRQKSTFWGLQIILFLSLLAPSIYDLGRLANPNYLEGRYGFPQSTRLLIANDDVSPDALEKFENLNNILIFAVKSGQASVYDPADQLLKRSFSMTINGEPLYFRPDDYKEKKQKKVLVVDSYEQLKPDTPAIYDPDLYAEGIHSFENLLQAGIQNGMEVYLVSDHPAEIESAASLLEENGLKPEKYELPYQPGNLLQAGIDACFQYQTRLITLACVSLYAVIFGFVIRFTAVSFNRNLIWKELILLVFFLAASYGCLAAVEFGSAAAGFALQIAALAFALHLLSLLLIHLFSNEKVRKKWSQLIGILQAAFLGFAIFNFSELITGLVSTLIDFPNGGTLLVWALLFVSIASLLFIIALAVYYRRLAVLDPIHLSFKNWLLISVITVLALIVIFFTLGGLYWQTALLSVVSLTGYSLIQYSSITRKANSE